MNEINEQTTTTTSGMAQLLGISERTLQRLQAEDWISGKVGRDQWNVFRTTKFYLNHVALEAASKR